MLTWLMLAALLAFSAGTFVLGRRRALAAAGAPPARLHSLPNYYGWYVALWSGVPALVLLCLFALFGGRLETALLAAELPQAVRALPQDQIALFVRDAQAVAVGASPSLTIYDPGLQAALQSEAQEARRISAMVRGGAYALALILALAALLVALPQVSERLRARDKVERWIKVILMSSSAVAVLTTAGIILSLLF